MARAMNRFKIEARGGLYYVKHRCVFGLWKNSTNLFAPAPNRFISRQCAEDGLKRMAEIKDLAYEIVE